jgi:hypothetical protein
MFLKTATTLRISMQKQTIFTHTDFWVVKKCGKAQGYHVLQNPAAPCPQSETQGFTF